MTAILAAVINSELLPDAALCVELELAADVVAVVPSTTEIFTLDELVHLSPESVVALLLKVMSAHWFRSQ
jgi:hypothetical protein